MPPTSQNSFAWTDPRTGKRYWGDEAGARMVAHMTGQPGPPEKGINSPLPLPPPPPGTYDPAIDYNAGASQRGYDNQRDDAATMYSQGTEDYGLDLAGMTQGRDRTYDDIARDTTRFNEDIATQANGVRRNYGILGRQQGERAAQSGVTSQGLLGKSNAVRGENQERDLDVIRTAETRGHQDFNQARIRTGEDFDSGKTRLDLGFGRQFGGYGGNTFNNPLTGQPMVGSLLTGQTRSGTENNQFQTFSGQQRSMQAADNGYIAPGLLQTSPDLRTARRVQRGMRR